MGEKDLIRKRFIEQMHKQDLRFEGSNFLHFHAADIFILDVMLCFNVEASSLNLTFSSRMGVPEKYFHEGFGLKDLSTLQLPHYLII